MQKPESMNRMKGIFLVGALGLSLLTSCTGNSGTGEDGNSQEEVSKVAIPDALPGSKEVKEKLQLLVEKAGYNSIDEVEFFDLTVSFSESIIEGSDPNVDIAATMVSKKDKNKLFEYKYDYSEGKVSEPSEVTLTSGFGSNQEIVEDYEAFKSNLFTAADFPSLDKLDGMYKTAAENSGYKKDEQYLSSFKVGHSSMGNFEIYVYVRSTRVATMSKSVHFDKTGALIK